MDTHQRWVFRCHSPHHQRQMQTFIDNILVGEQVKIPVLRRQFTLSDTFDAFLIGDPVVDQVGNGADFQIMFLGKAFQIGAPRHAAVLIENFDDHRGGFQPGQPRQIAAGFGVTGAGQHTAGHRCQRKDVARLHDIGRFGVGRYSGLYRSGAIGDKVVPGYRDELDGQESDTETFVAIKAEIDNWRWADTPFYLRSGKRLAGKASEIVVQFRPIAHSIFPRGSGKAEANRLTIRLQPDEGVELSMVTKVPGPGDFKLRSLPLNLSFSDTWEKGYPDAYERLLMEVLRGDPALFMHREEVERAWKWIDGIIESWQEREMEVQDYVAGTWGPTDSVRLLDRDGREWCQPHV